MSHIQENFILPQRNPALSAEEVIFVERKDPERIREAKLFRLRVFAGRVCLVLATPLPQSGKFHRQDALALEIARALDPHPGEVIYQPVSKMDTVGNAPLVSKVSASCPSSLWARLTSRLIRE